MRFVSTTLIVAALAAPLAAQSNDPAAAAHVRQMLASDTLSTSKKILQDYLVELRDTLSIVASLNERMIRSRNSGMSAVVLSSARQLQRACKASVAEVARTKVHLATFNTNDPAGINALATYRVELDQLAGSLRDCGKDDSIAVAARPFDAKRANSIASAAGDAIATHDQIRDALVSLFGFKMPATGYIPKPRPLH